MADAVEYRATLTCNQNPCTYCQRPRRTFLPSHNLVFGHATNAVEYGQVMRQKVYGSEHRIGVQSRTVTDWKDVEDA